MCCDWCTNPKDLFAMQSFLQIYDLYAPIDILRLWHGLWHGQSPRQRFLQGFGQSPLGRRRSLLKKRVLQIFLQIFDLYTGGDQIYDLYLYAVQIRRKRKTWKQSDAVEFVNKKIIFKKTKYAHSCKKDSVTLFACNRVRTCVSKRKQIMSLPL